jgi:hypothetical protein
MIDRQSPDQSLFLQYALGKDATYLHPKKDKYPVKVKISGTDDQRFKDLTAAVSLLKLPAPDYGFKWSVPKPVVATTAPATTTSKAAE